MGVFKSAGVAAAAYKSEMFTTLEKFNEKLLACRRKFGSDEAAAAAAAAKNGS